MTQKGRSGDASNIARLAAMDMLARREHSRHELQEKLAQRFPDFSIEEVIVPVLERLSEENLQSDERFVEAFVRYRSSRGNGPLKIAAELYPKKIAESLLKSALANAGDFNALCLEALQKKAGSTHDVSVRERMKWSRFLQQRGFTTEQIRQAFRMMELDDE